MSILPNREKDCFFFFFSPSVFGPLYICTGSWELHRSHHQLLLICPLRIRGLKKWHTPDPIQLVTRLESFAVSGYSHCLTYIFSLRGDRDIPWKKCHDWSLMQLIVGQMFAYFDKERVGQRAGLPPNTGSSFWWKQDQFRLLRRLAQYLSRV